MPEEPENMHPDIDTPWGTMTANTTTVLPDARAREAIARIVCEIVVRITCPDYASEASIQGNINESWKHWTDTADRILAATQPAPDAAVPAGQWRCKGCGWLGKDAIGMDHPQNGCDLELMRFHPAAAPKVASEGAGKVEAIARIIDPLTWRDRDNYVLIMQATPGCAPETIADQAHQRVRHSLRAAHDVLAALAPDATDGATGGGEAGSR